MVDRLDPQEFAKAKFAFPEGVGDDAELPKIAARVAVKLVTKYMRAETGGVAWPSIRLLCADLSVSADSGIRKALSAMVANGHLNADHVVGSSTRYTIAKKYFGPSAAHSEPRTPLSFEAGSNDTPPIFEATSTGHRNPDKEIRTRKSGQGDSPPSPSQVQKPAEEVCRFEEWYASFPDCKGKRTGKPSSRKLYLKLVKSGVSEEDLLLGAMRHAEEAEKTDPRKRYQYTMGPVRWLEERHWEDDPPPAQSPAYGGGISIFGEAPRQRPNPRDGHGFCTMRVEEFLQ